MIREEAVYNQMRLFIRYVVGRKSPLNLIAYIEEQFLFHDFIKLAQTPDGITLKVEKGKRVYFVPLGHPEDPICVVYLSLIGGAIFASSHSTYMKRIDFVKHLRLKEPGKEVKPELAVLIPNAAPYIKRLNQRLGYKAILNKKIGREAGYFFETDNFRGNQPVPYHMDKRKFTHSWKKGKRVLFYTHPGGAWDIFKGLNEEEIFCIPAYNEKELKTFSREYKADFILFDSGKSGEGPDMFGHINTELKFDKVPVKYFSSGENGSIELWDDKEKVLCKDVNELGEKLRSFFKKTGEKKK